jgi:predicted HTH domain antitoxin
MSLEIPDEILQAAHVSAEELRREIALLLHQQDRLTLGQASALAHMSQREFQSLLADRQIPLHYDVEEFEADLKTLDQLSGQ